MKVRPVLPLIAASALLLPAACDAFDPLPADDVVVRDSLGIQIVENHAPAMGDPLPWRVELEPSLVLGETDQRPEEVFHRVEKVLRLSDGRIAVTDRGSNEIRIFSEDGRFAAALGGSGEGPGEFGDLGWVRQNPLDENLLLAYDQRGGSVLHLDAEGREAERIRVEGFRPDLIPTELEGDGRLGGSLILVGVFADGTFLSEAFESVLPQDMSTENGLWSFETLLLHVGDEGTQVEPIGRFLRSRHLVDEASGRLISLPFGPRGYTRPFGTRILHMDGVAFELRLFDRSGALVEIWRRSWSPTPLTDEDRREARAASLQAVGYVEGEPESEAVTLRRRLLDQVPWPTHHPALDAVVPDREGNVWVREIAAPDDPDLRSWSVFAGDGRWLGRALLPEALEVREIGADYILGVTSDPLGVERVQMHRLERAPGA